MKKWQLAGYLIENKKVIDSIMFINLNIRELRNLDLKSIIEEKIQKFYINLRIIYDKCLSKNEKEDLSKKDQIYKETLYHRDKRYAHKDDNYNKKEYASREEMIDDLKEKMLHCYEICKKVLPKEVTFDFIPYDSNLYRMINNITPQKEELLKQMMYNLLTNTIDKDIKGYKVFNDIDDINYIKETKKYAVLIENGINLYEGLQNRQDACIKINVLYDLNIWCNVSEDINTREKEYEKIIEEILQI